MNDTEHNPWSVSPGTQVRRTGADFGTSNTGIVVDYVAAPIPTVEGLDAEDPQACAFWAMQASIASSLPAQIKVYWTQTGLVSEHLSTEVVANYPGGARYCAWDREFPLLAVETDGHHGVAVYTPDGEEAVTVHEPSDEPYSYENWKARVLGAVAQYLDTTPARNSVVEAAEAVFDEQFENAEFENLDDCAESAF